MNKEDYVSLEVAKLLKEKGYCWPCDSFYTLKGLIQFRSIADNFNRLTAYSRPALYEAQKWLRLTHGIHVYPSVYLSKDDDENCLYMVESYKYNGSCWESFELNTIKYDTYEEALNAGIFEALKLI